MKIFFGVIVRYWPVDQAFPRTRETTLLRAKPKAHRHTKPRNRPSGKCWRILSCGFLRKRRKTNVRNACYERLSVCFEKEFRVPASLFLGAVALDSVSFFTSILYLDRELRNPSRQCPQRTYPRHERSCAVHIASAVSAL